MDCLLDAILGRCFWRVKRGQGSRADPGHDGETRQPWKHFSISLEELEEMVKSAQVFLKL